MTEVAFHFNVADKTAYTGRLLRKIYRSAARAVVVGDVATLEAVDRMLWIAAPDDFVPHLHVKAAAPDSSAVQLTPLLMFADTMPFDASLARSHQILINLSQDVPAQLDLGWQRCIEIVSLDEQDRHHARRRWRHYDALGWPIQKHEIAS